MRQAISHVVSFGVMVSAISAGSYLLTSSPAQARPREVRCELTIGGRSYIRGICDFIPIGGDGSFQIWDHEDQPYFAQLNISRPGVGDGYWNAKRDGSDASTSLGMLTRRGGCWVNRRVRLCAIAL